MKKTACLFMFLTTPLLAAGTVFPGPGAIIPTLPPQNPARRVEIAAHLPERPGLPGLRPEDRPRWRALADKSPTRPAEELLAQPVPPITDAVYLKCHVHGDANIQPQAYWKRHNALSTLAFAEAFEQKGRFLAKIAEYLEAYCAEKSWLFAVHDPGADVFYGRQPPKIDLGVAHRAEILGFTLALHRDRLPPEAKVVFLEHSGEMPRIYALSAVVVSASSVQPEAFGRVIPEAQAMRAASATCRAS